MGLTPEYSSAARVPDLDSGGRRFESFYSDLGNDVINIPSTEMEFPPHEGGFPYYSSVTQRLEYRLYTAAVIGSNPIWWTIHL